ncbi:MAG: hypothetical protein L0215_25445 [Gemmataceae bacterium]|nr:hypothetical protein [Gemmataceae bacterium]
MILDSGLQRALPWTFGGALFLCAISLLAQDNAARPSVAEIESLHRLIKPQPGESRWMEIDWYPSVWEARQKAAQEGKPLFLWAGSGGAPPAGC